MIIKEPNGEVRDANNYQVIGHWFDVDGVEYWMPLNTDK